MTKKDYIVKRNVHYIASSLRDLCCKKILFNFKCKMMWMKPGFHMCTLFTSLYELVLWKREKIVQIFIKRRWWWELTLQIQNMMAHEDRSFVIESSAWLCYRFSCMVWLRVTFLATWSCIIAHFLTRAKMWLFLNILYRQRSTL